MVNDLWASGVQGCAHTSIRKSDFIQNYVNEKFYLSFSLNSEGMGGYPSTHWKKTHLSITGKACNIYKSTSIKSHMSTLNEGFRSAGLLEDTSVQSVNVQTLNSVRIMNNGMCIQSDLAN